MCQNKKPISCFFAFACFNCILFCSLNLRAFRFAKKLKRKKRLKARLKKLITLCTIINEVAAKNQKSMGKSQRIGSLSTTELYGLSDAELMARAKLGDERAFQVIYLRYRDWVLRLAMRFVHFDNDAQDVLQEVFKYLFSIVPKYEPKAQLTTLLYKVTRNVSISELKKQRRKRGVSLDIEEAANIVAAQDQQSDKEPAIDHNEVTRVINNLPDTYREVLILRLVEEWNYQDIADTLEIPLGTVKSRIHNGLELLRKRLPKLL